MTTRRGVKRAGMHEPLFTRRDTRLGQPHVGRVARRLLRKDVQASKLRTSFRRV